MGKLRNIKSQEHMLELFDSYIDQTKHNPIMVHDYVGGVAKEVRIEKQRPLTLEGFINYAYNRVGYIHQYFENTGGNYDEYLGVCSHIRRLIRQDQIEGGMAGIYNPSITQRLNGLVEKQEMAIKEQPLFPDEPAKD